MNFLRENLFLVLLTVGTLLICLILVLWSGAIASQIDEREIAPRQELSDAIQQLSRPPYDNGNTIIAEKQRVEGIRGALQACLQENIAWNSRNFQVPALAMLDGSTRPAFPFDAKVWEKNQLANRYVLQYHDHLDSLFSSLKPASLPTPQELTDEAVRQQKILERREEIRKKESQDAAAAAVAPPAAAHPPTVPPAMVAAPYPIPAAAPAARTPVPAAPLPGGVSATTLGAESQQRAREVLRIRKAQEGVIYADRNSSFQIDYPKGIILSAADVDAEKFWKAQLGLWVQTDVVGAINDTIQTAFEQQKLPPHQRNVIFSPVKRLVSIAMGNIPVAVRPTTPASSRGGMAPGVRYPYPPPGGAPTMPPGAAGPYGPPEAGPYGPVGMTGPYGSPAPGAVPRGYPAGTPGTPVESQKTLTQHTANKVFDVVDYTFTVIMPTRYLPLLQECLLKRNYHVILNMNVEPADPAKASAASADAATEEMYYYGVEPVSKVTINAQLLLMTGFTRGLWDEEKRQWRREPLMPLELLRKLPDSALRPEDKQLIAGQLPQPWNPAAAAIPAAPTPDIRRPPVRWPPPGGGR